MKKILKFSADWCNPCKVLAKNLEQAGIAIPIENIDIDNDDQLAMQYKIRGVPTLVLVEAGVEVKRVSGVKSVSELLDWVK